MSSDLQERETEGPEAKKPSRQILQLEIMEGLEALQGSRFGLFISAISAGLDIGFSLFLMAVVHTMMDESWSRPVARFLVANMYAVGFLFVVLGRSELFTEQTSLAVLPVLNGRASLGRLLGLWVTVFVANLIGAAIFAELAVLIGPALGIIEPRAFGEIARPIVSHPGLVIFASAMLAGWLMGLLSWLVAASRDTISQIVIVWLIATVIGLAGLHHVVVGSVEVFSGIFAGQGITMSDYGHFVLWTALGNIAGGSFFVAIIKYSYAIRGRRQPG